MRQIYLFVIAVMFFQQVKADHVSGANITYRCLSGNTYEITLDFYRDCKGIAGVGGCNLTFNSACTSISGASCSGGSPNPIYFSYYSPTCHYCRTDSFTYASAVVTAVTPTCPGIATTCNGGTITGMERWTMKKTITLPSQCADWTFVFGDFARNVSLNSINNATGTGFAVYSTLNNLAVSCNSSPSFTVPSITYLCAGHPYCFNEGTIEPDGDSLVYSLVQPRSSTFSNNYVTYNTGYAYNNPFGTGSPITFDPITGSVCVTPQNNITTVMAVKVSEYRNGVLIGTIERDMEFVVIPCSNDLPVVSGINGAVYATNHTDTICAGTAYCFTVNGTDPNSGDTLNMSWNNSITGATFNVTGNNTKTPTGQFCWTPTVADVRSAPYVFTVQIKDNACPYNGVQYFPFRIFVKNCAGCVLKASFYSSDTVFCDEIGKCLTFTDNSTCNPISWKWTFTGAQPDTSTAQNPTNICYRNPGTYPVKLVITNASGSDSLNVNPLIIFGTNIPPTITHPPLHGDTLFASHGKTYQWQLNGVPIPGATDSFYVAKQSGTYSVIVKDDLGCTSISGGIPITVGVDSITAEDPFIIYPNPAGKWFAIHNFSKYHGDIALNIYNIIGEKLHSQSVSLSQHSAPIVVDVSSFSPGIYVVELKDNNNKWVSKLIKE